jgi:hypothetical protein
MMGEFALSDVLGQFDGDRELYATLKPFLLHDQVGEKP